MIWRGFYFYRRPDGPPAGAAGPGVSAMALGADGALHRRHPDAASAGEHGHHPVSNTVTRIVSEAVYEAIEKGELQYDGLVLREGHGGPHHRCAEQHGGLQPPAGGDSGHGPDPDRPGAHRDLSIPIGSLTGSTLLAGRGPGSPCGWSPWGRRRPTSATPSPPPASTRPSIQIILTVDVSVSILLPGFRTATKVSNFLHRGGDGDRGHGAGHLHLFLHRSGYL